MILSHRSQVTHTCVSKLRHRCWYTGSSPGLRQANIWTSDGVLLIEPLGAHLIENSFTSLPNFKRLSVAVMTFATIWSDLTTRKEITTKLNSRATDHYDDVIMGAMASQITSLMVVYSTFYSAADKRKHQSSASLACVRRIHRWPVNSPHKWPATRKMFPFDNVIMRWISVMS